MSRSGTARPRGIAPALLTWYDRRRRDLPWRRLATPYRTLVSEFMLQQTVVATVIPFFERFTARFPDVGALAGAHQDEVAALWSGLGYYARARNLHRAAQAVVSLHGGEIPATEAALRALPGIGPYTAAAVAAIAFDKRTFALDGNAARVVARLAGIAEPIDKPTTRRRLHEIGLAAVPARRCGDFAQAVMELGATVCVPRVPACGICPLADACVARRNGTTARIPSKTARPAKRLVRLVSVRLRQEGRVLLVRSKVGLLAGTWMLPAVVLAGAGREAAPARAARALLRGLEIAAPALHPVGRVRHVFTHRDVTVEVFDAAPAGGGARSPRRAFGGHANEASRSILGSSSRPAPPDLRWVDEARLDAVAVSSFLRKQLALPTEET